ncbi:MAG TPA: hypothetical protein VJZ27_15490 [Aggregatilineales bacterium]|nr:hypothetical protein [Aggregatilineales bacterium]
MSDNLYIMRVRLSWAKRVWREIAIRGDQTLADLHRGILDAFEWRDDDTYSFYMTDEIGDQRGLFSPDADDMHNPESARLDDFDLYEEQTFIYIYGVGERNQFPIKVMMIDEPDSFSDYPDVVDEHGDSPEQNFAYYDD